MFSLSWVLFLAMIIRLSGQKSQKQWRILTIEQFHNRPKLDCVSKLNLAVSTPICPSTLIETTLPIVLELGYLHVDSRHDVFEIILPQYSVHYPSRLLALTNYLNDYFQYRSFHNIIISCYFTIYDGWREHTEPYAMPLFQIFSGFELKEKGFIGKGTNNEEGRFIKTSRNNSFLFPKFDRNILTFSRHKNDPTVILIPDSQFIETIGYKDVRKNIDKLLASNQWNQKIDKLIWRGSNNGVGYQAYNSFLQNHKLAQSMMNEEERNKLYNQRAIFIILITANLNSNNNNNKIDKNWIDAKMILTDNNKQYNVLDYVEMSQYRYQIDIDGEVNAWSGLFWKLYSNSTVFKVESHFEEWYYGDLVPWTHYIPVNGDMSDLMEKIEWAKQNDHRCQEIADRGRRFAMDLTYEAVVRNYAIIDNLGGE